MEGAAVVALEYEGKTLALLRAPEIFEHRKEERATRTFGINADRGHPSAERSPAPAIVRHPPSFLLQILFLPSCFLFPSAFASQFKVVRGFWCTASPAHGRYIDMIFEGGEWLMGGKLEVPGTVQRQPDLRKTPTSVQNNPEG